MLSSIPTKDLQRILVGAVRCQLFEHCLPEKELREGLEVFVVGRMVGFDNFRDIPDVNLFIEQNRHIIDPIVTEAIVAGRKAGPR